MNDIMQDFQQWERHKLCVLISFAPGCYLILSLQMNVLSLWEAIHPVFHSCMW